MVDKFLARRSAAPAPDFAPLRGRRVLVALSGGADSVALLVMLCEAREDLGATLFAAHLDHGIRPESAGDAEWCRALCARLGVPLYAERIDVPALAAQCGEGLESVARRERYRFLRRIKADVGANCIALAHHMDDQAETVLMHLSRGAGPEGIGGMAVISGDLVRPLLAFRKRELEAWLSRRGLTWREDATNAVADNPRNALRMHGIPALEQSYPQFVAAAARYAQSARIESDFVKDQTEVWMKGRVDRGPYGQRLLLDEMPHPAILRRAIRAICLGDIGWERLNAVEALAGASHGAQEISKDLRAERGRRHLYFLRGEPAPMREAPLDLNGVTALPGLCEISAKPSPPEAVRDDPFRQVLDAAALKGAVLRTRQNGDRFRPLGCGDRLLSDFLTDRKVDRPLRDYLALVARENRVLWVCGLGISEDAKLTGGTERAVALDCRYGFDIES